MNSQIWQIWQSASLSEKTNIILAGAAIAQAVIYLCTFLPILITMVFTKRYVKSSRDAVRVTEIATVAQIILPLRAEWSGKKIKNNVEAIKKYIKQKKKKPPTAILGIMEIEAVQDASEREILLD